MDVAKAGWAEADITPPLGLPMGGRGPRFAPGAVMLDPLVAQAVALQDSDGNRTLWVSVDQDGLTRERAKKLRYELAALTDVPYGAVVVTCSHTHSGPMGNYSMLATSLPQPVTLRAYEDQRDQRILRLGWNAVENLQPVKITWRRGRSHIGINRRKKDDTGQTIMAPNPDGRYNPDLWILKLTAEKGNDQCLIFSYGCHPVIVYDFQWEGISADYPGLCRRLLRERFGQSVHCQFIQGLAGDIKPRILADLDCNRFRRSNPDDLEKVGDSLTQDLCAALEKEGEPLNLRLVAMSGWFQARRDLMQVPPPSYWAAEANSDDELRQNIGQYWLNLFQAKQPLMKATPWEIGLIQLTPEHLIAWFAGEPVAEWLIHLRSWFDNEQLIGWGYCQDTNGYLPTNEQIPAGGYEVVRSAQLFKSGPGPFIPSLNQAVQQSFQALKRLI